MGYYHSIHFTPAEAQAMLPEVVALVARMRELKDQLDRKGYDLRMHQHFGGIGANGLKAFPDQLEEIIRLFQELAAKGVVIKDLDKGLIDFPCLRGSGEEVYLCYMMGEPEIRFWHRINDGFPGRQGLESL
jgi:hypothetical protein